MMYIILKKFNRSNFCAKTFSTWVWILKLQKRKRKIKLFFVVLGLIASKCFFGSSHFSKISSKLKIKHETDIFINRNVISFLISKIL